MQTDIDSKRNMYYTNVSKNIGKERYNLKKFTDETLTPLERAELLTEEMTAEEQAAQLRYDAPALPRLGIPAYNWWNEGLHGLARTGTATMFPQAIGLAAAFDRELVRNAARVTGTEARAKYNACKRTDRDIYKGLTIWSPNINIFRDPRWGRGHETYGEDPYLTGELGCAYVKSLQGEGETPAAAACAKHFAVHSGPEALRHEFDAEVSEKDLEETYLPAFEALVKAGVMGVMGAYNRVNGEPACASRYLMKKLSQWGFKGYFVSDCWAVQDFHAHHHVTSNAVESAAMALKAGCHINCGCSYVNLLAALSEGLIDEEDIRNACVRAMETRFKLGMFDKHCVHDDIPYEAMCAPEHKSLALECSRRSFVLLHNNGILPLKKGIRTIAVIGPNADSRTALEGNYCGRADRYVTFLEGLQDSFEGRILYSEGCHLYKDRISSLAMAGDRYAEAAACAENADISIIFTGLDAGLEGEEGDTGNEFSSGDKEALLLPACQRRLIQLIRETGKPYIIVNVSGSSINVIPEFTGCCEDIGETYCDGAPGRYPDGIIQAFYPGAEGGRALAEILLGKISPSGKLPVTFYKTHRLLPEFTDYSMENRTYRFVKDNENVLFPFGFGLTYGHIICSDIEYADGKVTVRAVNESDTYCEDVIEVYCRRHDEFAPERAVLCGFKRVCLAPGETASVDIELDKRAFLSVDNTGKRGLFCNRVTLYAGTCQPEEMSEGLTGSRAARTELIINNEGTAKLIG